MNQEDKEIVLNKIDEMKDDMDSTKQDVAQNEQS